MDDLEGEVVGEKVHKCGLGENMFSSDLDGEDALLRIYESTVCGV